MIKSNAWTAKIAKWRGLVQTAFLFVWVSPWLRLHTYCSPVFHCYSCPWATFACPIGVVANFGAWGMISLIAVGTILFFAALFGALICGWACPFGFLQDLIAKIPLPKFRLPAWTGYLRYVVLVGAVLAIPYFFGIEHPLSICRICPAGAIEGAGPLVVQEAWAGNPIPWPSLSKIVITVTFLVGAMVIVRPWCTLLCPLGALFTLFNRFSFLPLRFRPSKCNHCSACKSMCQYRGANQERADELRCVRCLDCTQCEALVLATAPSLIDLDVPPKMHQDEGDSREKSTDDEDGPPNNA